MRTSSRQNEGHSRSQAVAVASTWVGRSKPVLYMLMSTVLLLLLVWMFSQSFGPGAMSRQHDFSRHHVSHNVIPKKLMRI